MSAADGPSGETQPAARTAAPTTLKNPSRQELRLHLTSGDMAWIDLEGPTEADLHDVAEHIKLHPLTLDDAQSFDQRPKIEDYRDYVFMVVFGVDPGTEAGGPLLREVHMIVTSEAVVTIHRRPNASLDRLRKRVDDAPDGDKMFLVYEILDAVTSTFVPVLSRIDDDIDSIEERIIARPREEDMRRISALKRDLVAMRRVISPMRDMFQRREDHLTHLAGMQPDDMLYFRDLYDGLIRTSEMIDSYRDLLSGSSDLYLSTVANRQGEVNRQLTIIATIFLPLTFFTGFFGQNFSLLTGHFINHGWTFWVFGVGLLVVSVCGFWWWFHRKGWIGRDAAN